MLLYQQGRTLSTPFLNFSRIICTNFRQGHASGFWQTAYERKFREQGLPITYLRFMLGGRSEFEVPDFEEDDNLDASQLGE